jgi:ParB-like chromosome segregation protein Spo0J
MCGSIREFGLKIPVLARSDGTVVDGHLRIKAARKLGSWPGGDITAIPVILCDEWTDTQVKAFRLMVNRSVTWADWDDELLALELQELNEADFDLSLTGFDPKEIDDLLLAPDDDDKPMPRRCCPRTRCRDLATCGSAVGTECFAEMLLARRP